jgi:hypothetical protein
MDKKHLLLITVGLALILLATSAHAQSANAVFSGPQNMDAGLQNGMNNLTGYVHFLPLYVSMPKAKEFGLSEGGQAYRGPHSEASA